MAFRGTRTSLTERLTIRDLAQEGQTDRTIASTLQRSRWTVRKWRRRARSGDVASLRTRLGRPPGGPLATFPRPLVSTIRQLRVDHPGWGAATILVELQRTPQWMDTRLPSRARIGAFLHAEGLARAVRTTTTLPEPVHLPEPAPHELWQVDAKGCQRVPALGLVSLINIVDEGSGAKIESMPSARWAPGLKDYHLALRRAFLRWGLPEAISFDHGTVFFDNTTPSPFPTRIHLWLIALGVQVAFCRPRQPTDHAMVERFHQTIDRQTLWGQTWTDFRALWQGLDDRREVLNTRYPSRTGGGQPPLVDIPAASHSGRHYEGGQRFKRNPPAQHKSHFAAFLSHLRAPIARMYEASDNGFDGKDDAKWMFCVVLASFFDHYGYLANFSRIVALPHYRPEWEESMLDLGRVGAYLAGAYWIRQGSPGGMIGLGGEKYWIGPAIAKQTVHVTFDPTAWQFLVHVVGTGKAIPMRPRGLSKMALMGDLAVFNRLPSYQLALPYDAATWRDNAYDRLLHP